MMFIPIGCSDGGSSDEDSENDSDYDSVGVDEEDLMMDEEDIIDDEDGVQADTENDYDIEDIDLISGDDEFPENDESLTDEDNSLPEVCSLIEVIKGGNESCPYPSTEEHYIRFTGGGTNFESSLLRSDTGLSFLIDEIRFSEDVEGISPGDGRKSIYVSGNCIGEAGDDGKNRCTATFSGYDENLFDQNALIGKEWVLYLVTGFYGDINGEYIGRELFVVKKKDGTIISVAGSGIVNENNENEWDKKVWPSSLVPGITAEPVPDVSSCAAMTCGLSVSGNGTTEIKIAPPIKFSRNGEEIIVKNGEVIEKDGYIYNVRGSMMAHPQDGDQMLSDMGKKYRFDFFIVNTEALK